jgi:hypothetical protein
MILPILLLVVGAVACNLPQQPALPAAATPDIGLMVAQTQTAMAVSQYLTATTPPENPTLTNTPVQAQAPESSPTNTPLAVIQVTTIGPSVTQPPVISPVPAQPNCTNAAKFVNETIPDNTVFTPNQQFMKTWTLQNVGTCTWTPDYALVYTEGDQMSGTSPSPIGQSVPPGGMIQIFLPQTAPQALGLYQGFWKLRSPSGQVFGLGSNAQTAFWVKINVAGQASDTTTFSGPQNLGAPSWVESFDGHSSPWYLGTDSGIDYDLKNGQLVITAGKPTGDQWRVAQPGYLADFYLQADFKSGAVCSGKDGYGLLVRAPDKANGMINSGYVFGFSCDGKYRVYRMDNGSYSGVKNWTANPAVAVGPNKKNVMGVYAKGGKLQLYANGMMIYEFTDSTYSGGLFGLMIRSEATNNYQVFVDQVAAWVLH